MKKLFFIASLVLIGMSLSAQNIDDVTLVVSGDGATKEEATHIALRSAIEQAYGVFVSANTEILNDELVKDEIATVTSGNVKSYKELSATILPNGNHMVSLQAVVSTKKLAAYAESKGSSCEFAGATFGANLKLLELNRKNTELAFDNLLKQCEAIVPYLFETKIEVGDPNVRGQLPILISLYSTPNTWEFCNLISSTLDALKLNYEQIQSLDQIDAKTYGIEVIACSREARYEDNRVNAEISDYYHRGGAGSSYIHNPVTIIYNDDHQLEAWYWDEDIKQPHRKAYGKSGYTNYFYAEFPFAKIKDIIEKKSPKYYITDDLGNINEMVNVIDLIIGDSKVPYAVNNGYEYVERDLLFSCFYFGKSPQWADYYRISFPYSYIKPYVLKKTKEIKYPEKIIGKKQITLDIPIEILSQISNFEILKYED